MATATLTSTAAASGVPPRAVHAGLNSLSVQFDSGATSLSGASTVYMAKIPSGATIVDVIQFHSSGAATCPMDIGMSTAGDTANTLSALATQATQGSATHATRGVPYDVDASQTVTAGYEILKCTTTAGTETANVKINLTVLYTMDK